MFGGSCSRRLGEAGAQRPFPHRREEKGIIAVTPQRRQSPFQCSNLRQSRIKELLLNHDDDTNDTRNDGSRRRAFVIDHFSVLRRISERLQSITPDTCINEIRTPCRIASLLAVLYFFIRHTMEYHDAQVISIGILVSTVLGIWFARHAIRAFVVHNFAKRLLPDELDSIVRLLKALQTSLWAGAVLCFIATMHTMRVRPNIAFVLTIGFYAFEAAALLTNACEKHALKAAARAPHPPRR